MYIRRYNINVNQSTHGHHRVYFLTNTSTIYKKVIFLKFFLMILPVHTSTEQCVQENPYKSWLTLDFYRTLLHAVKFPLHFKLNLRQTFFQQKSHLSRTRHLND